MITFILAIIINFSALWDNATSATVSWYQTDRACLYWQAVGAQPIFINCYERTNVTYVIEVGHVGPLSGDLRPTTGGNYILITKSEVITTSLLGRKQFLPVFH